MDKKDFLLLVIAAGDGTPLTPVQLQKSLFLVGENLKGEIPDLFYQFEPYHYGPFDIEVYSDADFLESEGLLVSVRSSRGSWVDRGITPRGIERAKAIEDQLSESTRNYIRAVVEWAQSLSFSGLVKSIYQQYPFYKENSVFQG